ncbi:uncharacterized protein LOC102379505 isoform X2 [Alligator sinensis]|uniref:Uncharacterized protein LOC102379505 isoform X2 n=1 Tax=Alligator sinensis TaxID=38654 RepID=A0A1U8CU71_ALLSI|nr:uncharacterized protein LOC102379505 isoform X2 [Alligator sinensis]
MPDQKWYRHNCIKEPFCVLSTSGGLKTRRRNVLFRNKFLDTYSGYPEDMTTRSDYSLNFSNNRNRRRIQFLQAFKTPEAVAWADISLSEDQEFPHTSSNSVLTATETQDDIYMEPINDSKIPMEKNSKEKMAFPTRLTRPFELSRKSGVIMEAMSHTPDYSLFMDIDPSKSGGFLDSLGTAALQPLLLDHDGSMQEESIIQSKQVLPILDWVGEKLRTKLHMS